jgi:hypothetical protein
VTIFVRSGLLRPHRSDFSLGTNLVPRSSGVPFFDRRGIRDQAPRAHEKVVTLGFMGTYDDAGAEIDAVALVGKQTVRFKSTLRLLVAG